MVELENNKERSPFEGIFFYLKNLNIFRNECKCQMNLIVGSSVSFEETNNAF